MRIEFAPVHHLAQFMRGVAACLNAGVVDRPAAPEVLYPEHD